MKGIDTKYCKHCIYNWISDTHAPYCITNAPKKTNENNWIKLSIGRNQLSLLIKSMECLAPSNEIELVDKSALLSYFRELNERN
jgi:hypothetical protein